MPTATLPLRRDSLPIARATLPIARVVLPNAPAAVPSGRDALPNERGAAPIGTAPLPMPPAPVRFDRGAVPMLTGALSFRTGALPIDGDAHASPSASRPHFTRYVTTWLQSPSPVRLSGRNRKEQLVPTGRLVTVVRDCSVGGTAVHVFPPSELHCHS